MHTHYSYLTGREARTLVAAALAGEETATEDRRAGEAAVGFWAGGRDGVLAAVVVGCGAEVADVLAEAAAVVFAAALGPDLAGEAGGRFGLFPAAAVEPELGAAEVREGLFA